MPAVVRCAGIANSPVKAAFRDAGWRLGKRSSGRFLVCWGHIFSADELAGLHRFQRVNHFPGTWELGRKDYLYRNVSSLRRLKGSTTATRLDFIPPFFVLPRDLEELRTDMERYPGQLYIQKPVNSSRGRGVRVVVKPTELISRFERGGKHATKDLLVQRYIDQPYIINGHKFDMRVYVLATCMDPVRLYVYEEGLARFATEQYSCHKADLKNRCVHLTNYSVNKKSSKFVANEEEGQPDPQQQPQQQDGSFDTSQDGGYTPRSARMSENGTATASKWSLMELRQHVEHDRGVGAWRRVWRQVHDIVAGAVLAAEPRIASDVRSKAPDRNTCFEIWGFDVLVDDGLRCWLLEANTCPSLAGDSALDRRIKTRMISDALHCVGPVPYDVEVYEAQASAERHARLTGLATPLPHALRGDKHHGPPTPRQAPRHVRDAESMDFRGVPPRGLPDVVIEAEAEHARRLGWQRVFPCPQDPTRYLDLFETPRAASTLLCNYYTQKAGGAPLATGAGGPGRPSTTPGPSRPGTRGGVPPSRGAWGPSGTSSAKPDSTVLAPVESWHRQLSSAIVKG